MRRRTLFTAAILLLMTAESVCGWGYRAHFTVNSGAIDILPEPLRGFYHLNRNYVVPHAIDPDLWVDMKIKTPAYAHYIDLDMLDNAPFTGIPKEYASAAGKFGEETLKRAGTLPWEITRRKDELTTMFREHHWEDAVKASAWIGHFVADATMPLHTTRNYLGQLTGNIVLEERGPNRSVHHRLEWGLLQAFPEHYDGIMGRRENVKHVADVLEMSWVTVRSSYGLIDEVLAADKEAAAIDASFGPVYYRKFDALMRPLVEKRLRLAEELVASVWLTAWEDAGRPALPGRRIFIESPVCADAGAAEDAVSMTRAFTVVLLVVLAAIVGYGLWRGRRMHAGP